MSRSLDEDSLVDGPLISADALHSAIRREFQTVSTPCHAGLLSLLHVGYTHIYTHRQSMFTVYQQQHDFGNTCADVKYVFFHTNKTEKGLFYLPRKMNYL